MNNRNTHLSDQERLVSTVNQLILTLNKNNLDIGLALGQLG